MTGVETLAVGGLVEELGEGLESAQDTGGGDGIEGGLALEGDLELVGLVDLAVDGLVGVLGVLLGLLDGCPLYTSPSPRDS